MLHIVTSEQMYGGNAIMVFTHSDQAQRYKESLNPHITRVTPLEVFPRAVYAQQSVYIIGYLDQQTAVISHPSNGFDQLQAVPVSHLSNVPGWFTYRATSTGKSITADVTHIPFISANHVVRSPDLTPVVKKEETPPIRSPEKNSGFNLWSWLFNKQN